jgi:hypothetical protein
MGRRRSPDGPTKVISVRVASETLDWYKSLGEQGPIVLKAMIEEFRMTKSGRVLDSRLASLKDELSELEERALDIRKKIRELEGIKAKLLDAQLGYIQVRQKLLEKYMQDPRHFMGWLTGPANEHLIIEGKFEDVAEVVDYCRNEMERRCKK